MHHKRAHTRLEYLECYGEELGEEVWSQALPVPPVPEISVHDVKRAISDDIELAEAMTTLGFDLELASIIEQKLKIDTARQNKLAERISVTRLRKLYRNIANIRREELDVEHLLPSATFSLVRALHDDSLTPHVETLALGNLEEVDAARARLVGSQSKLRAMEGTMIAGVGHTDDSLQTMQHIFDDLIAQRDGERAMLKAYIGSAAQEFGALNTSLKLETYPPTLTQPAIDPNPYHRSPSRSVCGTQGTWETADGFGYVEDGTGGAGGRRGCL